MTDDATNIPNSEARSASTIISTNGNKKTSEHSLRMSKNRKVLQVAINGHGTVNIPLTEISKTSESVIMPLNDTLPPVREVNGFLKTDEYLFHDDVSEKEIISDIIHYLAVLKHLHDRKKTE